MRQVLDIPEFEDEIKPIRRHLHFKEKVVPKKKKQDLGNFFGESTWDEVDETADPLTDIKKGVATFRTDAIFGKISPVKKDPDVGRFVTTNFYKVTLHVTDEEQQDSRNGWWDAIGIGACIKVDGCNDLLTVLDMATNVDYETMSKVWVFNAKSNSRKGAIGREIPSENTLAVVLTGSDIER